MKKFRAFALFLFDFFGHLPYINNRTGTHGAPQIRKDVKMRTKTNVPSISHAAGLAGRAIARLEAAAESGHAQANGGRGFQAVSSKEGFAATIRHGKTLIEIQNDSFAVRQID
jgi:hypothetical protein